MPPSSPSPGERPRVLIADDDERSRNMLRTMLEMDGLRIAEESDGESLLRRVREEAFDLLLIDIGMPLVDGVSACREIRQASRVPIVILSGWADEGTLREALRAGADEYLLKPVGAERLLLTIRRLLESSLEPPR